MEASTTRIPPHTMRRAAMAAAVALSQTTSALPLAHRAATTIGPAGIETPSPPDMAPEQPALPRGRYLQESTERRLKREKEEQDEVVLMLGMAVVVVVVVIGVIWWVISSKKSLPKPPKQSKKKASTRSVALSAHAALRFWEGGPS
eukprot:COSAG01_NODE_16045_length_1275_cov_0.870748_2_plen_146_part_00